jgi:hypothetical protein
MLAARCCDRCPATGADGVAAPAIGVAVVLASSNTATRAAAVTAAIAPSIPAGSGPTAATSATTTSTATTTLG